MTIGEKKRKVRELKSYKQEYVADKLGMSVTAYGNIERNESRLSFERLEQIARVMEVSIPELLTIPEAIVFSSAPGIAPGCRPSAPVAEREGYGVALRTFEQLVDSLQKDIDYLRRQNEQLLELLRRKESAAGGRVIGRHN